MRRSDWLIVFVVLLVVTSVIVAYDVLAARRITPSADVRSLESFFAWQPGSHRAVLRERGGDEHLVVFGPLTGLAPSGPPAYVFDRSGRLVEWTRDSGDDPGFKRKWRPHQSQFRVVDRQRAILWMDGRFEDGKGASLAVED